MLEEILKEKTVMLGMCIYEEQGIIGGELNYKEFKKGNSLSEWADLSFPLEIDGVIVKNCDEKYWLNSLIEGIETFLSLDNAFIDVKKLVIDMSLMPSETLSGVSFYKPDNLEEILKERIKHEKFNHLKIRFM